MPKGEQRGNREAKKPKKPKPPAAIPVAMNRGPAKGNAFTPSKPK